MTEVGNQLFIRIACVYLPRAQLRGQNIERSLRAAVQNANVKLFASVQEKPALPFALYPRTFKVIVTAADKQHFLALYKIEPNNVVGIHLVGKRDIAEKRVHSARSEVVIHLLCKLIIARALIVGSYISLGGCAYLNANENVAVRAVFASLEVIYRAVYLFRLCAVFKKQLVIICEQVHNPFEVRLAAEISYAEFIVFRKAIYRLRNVVIKAFYVNYAVFRKQKPPARVNAVREPFNNVTEGDLRLFEPV